MGSATGQRQHLVPHLYYELHSLSGPLRGSVGMQRDGVWMAPWGGQGFGGLSRSVGHSRVLCCATMQVVRAHELGQACCAVAGGKHWGPALTTVPCLSFSNEQSRVGTLRLLDP